MPAVFQNARCGPFPGLKDNRGIIDAKPGDLPGLGPPRRSWSRVPGGDSPPASWPSWGDVDYSLGKAGGCVLIQTRGLPYLAGLLIPFSPDDAAFAQDRKRAGLSQP